MPDQRLASVHFTQRALWAFERQARQVARTIAVAKSADQVIE
jgi:hypothetical protein